MSARSCGFMPKAAAEGIMEVILLLAAGDVVFRDGVLGAAEVFDLLGEPRRCVSVIADLL